MPKNSIYLDGGLWRRDQSNERDPLRVFPELFNSNATGRSVATESAGATPDFEVAEMTHCFLLSARVPGITAAQLQVRVTAQLVIVSRTDGQANASATARDPDLMLAQVAFRRTFVLPTAVDARRLQVAIADDLLTVMLPKQMRVQLKRVEQKAR